MADSKFKQALAARTPFPVAQVPNSRESRNAAFFVSVMDELPNVPAEKVVARIKELVETERIAQKVADEFGLPVADLPRFVVTTLLRLIDEILAQFFGQDELASANFQRKIALLAQVPARIVNLKMAKGAPVRPDEAGVTFTADELAVMLQEIATKLHDGVPAGTIADELMEQAAQLRQLPELSRATKLFADTAAEISERVGLVPCPRCSKLNYPNAKTCEHCGRPLNIPPFLRVSPAPTAPPRPVAPPMPTPPPPPRPVAPLPRVPLAVKVIPAAIGAGQARNGVTQTVTLAPTSPQMDDVILCNKCHREISSPKTCPYCDEFS